MDEINRSDNPVKVKAKLNRAHNDAEWDRLLKLSFMCIESFRERHIAAGSITCETLWRDFWLHSSLVKEAILILRQQPDLFNSIRTAAQGLDYWLLRYAFKALVKRDAARKKHGTEVYDVRSPESSPETWAAPTPRLSMASTSQYPTSQYPTSQYPPSQYPSSQYPASPQPRREAIRLSEILNAETQ